MRQTILVERHGSGFGARVPGLPGVVAVAPTEAEVRELIREAISFSTSTGSQCSSLKRRPRLAAK
jgi:predicted RNase H-like HicB family nuclease